MTTLKQQQMEQLEIQFDQFLTSTICSRIVVETINYLLVQKGQIPFNYNFLKNSAVNSSSTNAQNTTANLKADRSLKKITETFSILDTLFLNLSRKITDNHVQIEEIVILFGGTPFTPKQTYRLCLPNMHLGHTSVNHSESVYLTRVIRSIVSSSSLSSMLNQQTGLTNMYVFIKKINFSANKSTSWFLPRERLPITGPQFKIIFSNPTEATDTCTCMQDAAAELASGFSLNIAKVDQRVDDVGQETLSTPQLMSFASDISGIEVLEFREEEDTEIIEPTTSSDLKTEVVEWYQAPVVLKGFKDVCLKRKEVPSSSFQCPNINV